MTRRTATVLLAVTAFLAVTASSVIPQTKSGNPAAKVADRQMARTIRTVSNVADSSFYTMTYKADYRLQEFIDADLTSQGEVANFAKKIFFKPEAPKAPVPEMKPACSAFQAVTPSGDVIYARNFDYRFKDSGTVLLRTNARKSYRSISMISTSFLGLDGHPMGDGKTDVSILAAAPYLQMDGMNEKGLAVSVLQLSHKAPMQFEAGKHSIMTSVFIRALLDRAATVDEAIELARSWNFFADGLQKGRKVQSNYHFLISDASGKTRLFEYIMEDGPESDSRWILNPVDVKAATNSYLSEGWEKYGSHDGRLSKINSRLEETGGVLTEEEAMQLLDSVHQTATKGHQGKTQWSVVYNLTRRTAMVCINHQYDKVYRFKL